jgi:glucokinase
MASPLLAGDVGGTNTRLSLLSPDGKKVLRAEVLPSHDFPTFEAAARRFLGKERVSAAALGIAGPVVNGRCTATNLPWVLDERALSRKLHIPRVVLMNDLIAAVHGAMRAPRSKLALLWGERFPSGKGNVAILAAGTGLGEAALVWDGTRHVPLSSEGGHCDFAPRNDLEMRLLAHLRRVLRKRVSYERVLSGPGIGNLYDFFVDAERVRETGRNTKLIEEATDRNAAIAQLGQSGKSRPAKRALDLFVSLLGAEAGNLALKILPTGGLFVSGGIAGRLLPQLRRGAFTSSFLDKGRMSTLLRTIPVAVVLDGGVGLKGSAHVAASLL